MLRAQNDNLNGKFNNISTGYLTNINQHQITLNIGNKETDRIEAIRLLTNTLSSIRQKGLSEKAYQLTYKAFEEIIDAPSSRLSSTSGAAAVARQILQNIFSKNTQISLKSERGQREYHLKQLSKSKLDALIKTDFMQDIKLLVLSNIPTNEEEKLEIKTIFDSYTAQETKVNALISREEKTELDKVTLEKGSIDKTQAIKDSKIKKLTLSNGIEVYLIVNEHAKVIQLVA